MKPTVAAFAIALALCHPRAGAAQVKSPPPALPPGAVTVLGEPCFRFDRFYHDFLLTPDGKALLALGAKKLHLCDLQTGKELASWPNARDQFRFAGITADGAEVATYSHSRAEFVYRDVTGRKKEVTVTFDLPAFRHVASAAISPDGRRAAFVVEMQTKNRVWYLLAVADRATGKPVVQLDRTVLHAAAFSPDGKTVAVSAEQYDPDARARMTSVLLYDVEGAGPPREVGRANEAQTKTHRAVAFSKDGKRLASFDPLRKAITFWEVADGKAVVPGPKGVSELAEGFPPSVRFVAWAAANLKQPDDFAISVGGDVYWPAAITPDGRTVVLRSVNREPFSLKLADVATRKELPITSDPAGYGAVHFVADGAALVAREWRAGWRLWDLRTKKIVPAVDGRDADAAAGAVPRDAAAWFKSFTSAGSPPPALEQRGFKKAGEGWEKVEELAKSPDGKTVVHKASRWSNLSGAVPRLSVTHAFADAATGKALAHLDAAGRAQGTFRFSPDGRTLAFAREGRLSFVEVSTGKELGSAPARGGLVFSADGGRAAAADDEEGIYLVNLRSGKTVLLSAADGVAALAFAPGGDRLAAGRRDGTILLLDLKALAAR